MNENLDSGEYTDPLSTVRRFVTTVLEHPLLTEETRERRRIFPHVVTSFLTDNGVDINRCVVIPWGDFVWSSTAESDYDMVIITADSATAQRVWDIQYKSNEMDIKGVACIDRLRQINDNWPYVPLFIPDDYISGDLSLVYRTRLLLTNPDYNTHHRFDKIAPRLFDIFFRNWRTMDWYRYDEPELQDHRAIHFNQLLDDVASRSEDPEAWKGAFLSNLNSIQVPDFSTYSHAMAASSGSLTLLF